MALANKKGTQISFQISTDLKTSFDTLLPGLGVSTKDAMINLIAAMVDGDAYVRALAKGEIPTMTPKAPRRDLLRVEEAIQPYILDMLSNYKSAKDWEGLFAAINHFQGARLGQVRK